MAKPTPELPPKPLEIGIKVTVPDSINGHEFYKIAKQTNHILLGQWLGRRGIITEPLETLDTSQVTALERASRMRTTIAMQGGQVTYEVAIPLP